MSRYAATQLPPSPRAREQAEDLARTAGRMGAARIPDEAHAILGPDPSDSAVIAILSAWEAGHLERHSPICAAGSGAPAGATAAERSDSKIAEADGRGAFGPNATSLQGATSHEIVS